MILAQMAAEAATTGPARLPGVLVQVGIGILIAAGVILFFNSLKQKSPRTKATMIIVNLAVILVLLILGPLAEVIELRILEGLVAMFAFNLVAFWILGAFERKEVQRALRLEEQLVDALLILSGALKAGRTLEQGFELVAKSLPDPISSEFQTVLQDQALGVPFDGALKQLMGRVGSKDFKLFITATLFQRETGGNIISLYDQITFAVAERKKLRGKLDSITVQGRYSGYLIAVLPLGLFLLMAWMNSDYVRCFYDKRYEVAQLLFVFAIFLEVTGVLVVRNIVNRRLG